MDPFTLLLGGGSLLGSIFGASAASETQANNRQANYLNYLNAQQERQDRLMAAQQARSDAKADKAEQRSDRSQTEFERKQGAQDAMGNRIMFVPGQGWVTIKGQDQQAEEDRIKAENEQDRAFLKTGRDEYRRQIAQEAPLRTATLERQFQQQSEQDRTSQGLLDAFRNFKGSNPDTIRGLLYDASRRGIEDSTAGQQSEVLRSALRSGAGNDRISDLVGALADSRNKALGNASADALLKSFGYSQAQDNAEKNQMLQAYQMFADRAGRGIDAGVNQQSVGNPQQLPGTQIQGFLNAFDQPTAPVQLSSLPANQLLVNAMGQQGGRLDYEQPDYGWANALSSMGSLAGAFGRQQQSKGNKSY